MTAAGMTIIDLPPGSTIRITTFEFLLPTGRKPGLLPLPTVPPPVQEDGPAAEPVDKTK